MLSRFTTEPDWIWNEWDQNMTVFGTSEIKIWMSNLIHCFLWDVIAYPRPTLNGVLNKLPLKLEHGLIIWVDVINLPCPNIYSGLGKLC